MSLTTVIAPSVEPVTVAVVKEHLNISSTFTSDDDWIGLHITTARKLIETKSGRQLMDATYNLVLDSFPSEIRVPKPPLQSVSSITYTDTAGDTQTLSSSLYQVDTDSEPARIRSSWGNTFPSTRNEMNAVTVQFVAGYASDYSDTESVPEYFKTCIKMIVGHWFENREFSTPVNLKEVPMAVDSLIWQEKVVKF